MVRLVGLTLTFFLVVFQFWYTAAPSSQRNKVPAPIRAGANVAAHAIVDTADVIGDAVGPRFRKGWRSTLENLGLREPPPPPRQGLMATNQDLTGQSFVAQRLDEATFLGATLDQADLTKAYLRRALMDGASAKGAVFTSAILEDLSGRAAKFGGARFDRADLTGATVQGADFAQADLSGAVLRRVQFATASLVGADLTGATVDRAIFYRADLSGAVLTGVTGLEQSQLDEACGDQATVLPEGFTLRPCGEALAATQLR